MPNRKQKLYLQLEAGRWIEWRFAGDRESRFVRASTELRGLVLPFTLPEPHPSLGKPEVLREIEGIGWRVSGPEHKPTSWRVVKTRGGAKRAAGMYAAKIGAAIEVAQRDKAGGALLSKFRKNLTADRRRIA